MEFGVVNNHRELSLQVDPWRTLFCALLRYEGEYQVSPCPKGSMSLRTCTTICPLGQPEIGLGDRVSDRTMVGYAVAIVPDQTNNGNLECSEGESMQWSVYRVRTSH